MVGEAVLWSLGLENVRQPYNVIVAWSRTYVFIGQRNS